MLIRPAYVTSAYGAGDGVWAWIIAVAVGETTDLPLLRKPMHLASDYVRPYKDVGHLVLHTRLIPILCASGIAADTALLTRAVVDSLACAPIF